MRKTLFLIAVASLTMVSCNMESPSAEQYGDDFMAGISSSLTKTTLDNLKVKWESGDKITINGCTYSTASAGEKVLFAADGAGATGSEFHAFYPAGIQTAQNSGELPAVQTYDPDGISNLPMYAHSENHELEFKNICAVLAIKVKSDAMAKVKSIKVCSGNKAMRGEFTVENDRAVLADSTAVAYTVTLNCPEAVTTSSEGSVFYIAIPAQTYQNLQIEVSSGTAASDSTKMIATKADTTITLSPSTLYTINVGSTKVVFDVVKDIKQANLVIAEQQAKSDTVNIKFAQQPNDGGVPGTEMASGDTSRAIVTTNLVEGKTLNIVVESETQALYIGDFQGEKDTTVVTAQSGIVNINIPSTGSIKRLVIRAPSKSVYLNGALVTSVGELTDVEASTSANTLVVEKHQQITGTLTVHQGGLEIHGTVANLVIDTAGTNSNVYVRACENLSQSVFDKIYTDGDHDYIDRPCYYEKQNSDGTWDILEYTAEDADLSLSYGGEIVGYTNMADFRDYVNGGYYFRHFTVTLLKDITITNDDNWVPIGTTDWENAFCGIFDGNNHKITLTKTGITGDYGLFILLYGFSQDEPAVVRNLKLDVSLTAADETKTWIGGVTNETGGYTRFENVTVSGNIVTGRFGGGFTGYNAGGTCVFEDCTNKANITAVIPSISGDNAYTIIGGISAQAAGSSVSYINCRNEGVLAADHTNSTSAPSYIGHMAGKGNYGSNNAFTITGCTYADAATITGWNVTEGDYSTFPFEGSISGTTHKTYFETPNPGKLMIGGYFTSCNLDGASTTGIYPNGIAHIQMTSAAYLSEMTAEEAEFGNAASGRGFYYTTGEGTARVFYKSKYDVGKFNSKANYSEQFKKDEYICYVPLTEMATVIGTFGDGFNSSLTWDSGTPTAADWAAYKTALASYTFTTDASSDACWSTSDSKIVHIYGTKVNDSLGKITIKTL